MNADLMARDAGRKGDDLCSSRRLWSLWDMLEKYGELYFVVGHSLGSVHQKIFSWQLRHKDSQVLGQSDATHTLAITSLWMAAEVCKKIPLGTLHKEIKRAVDEHKTTAFPDRLKMEIERIADRFRDELEKHKFLYVPDERSAFYGQQQLFGGKVVAKFEGASGDIEQAGNCYAVGQPTACVFHLMRAMEVAVRKLSKRLEVTITPQTTWRQMTNNMDHKIKALPDGTPREKAKKNDWEAARANLHHIGSVWRNNTMHPAASYTQSQALDVLNAVRVFMTDLAAL